MFESLFDIPLWITGPAIITVLCAFSVAEIVIGPPARASAFAG
jgi:hypothetical protein